MVTDLQCVAAVGGATSRSSGESDDGRHRYLHWLYLDSEGGACTEYCRCYTVNGDVHADDLGILNKRTGSGDNCHRVGHRHYSQRRSISLDTRPI